MNNIVPYNASLQKLASSFDCGNSYLNNFLNSADSLNNSVSKTYVFLTEDKAAIIGYYSITTGCITSSEEQASWRIGGSIHISELAVDKRYHRWHMALENDDSQISFSDILLTDCIDRILRLHEFLGFAFITLNSTAQGRSLYKRSGFEEIEEDMSIPSDKSERECTPMYLLLELLDY